MKRKYRLLFFSVLSVLLLCFIFGHSLQSRAVSSAKSSGISTWLKPILDPFEWMTEDQFHHLIRKLAHFIEFAALGMSLTGVAMNTVWTGKRVYLRPILWSAMAAVTDEIIQHFTGRACMAKDMLLDTCGAVCGVLAVCLIMRIMPRRRRNR